MRGLYPKADTLWYGRQAGDASDDVSERPWSEALLPGTCGERIGVVSTVLINPSSNSGAQRRGDGGGIDALRNGSEAGAVGPGRPLDGAAPIPEVHILRRVVPYHPEGSKGGLANDVGVLERWKLVPPRELPPVQDPARCSPETAGEAEEERWNEAPAPLELPGPLDVQSTTRKSGSTFEIRVDGPLVMGASGGSDKELQWSLNASVRVTGAEYVFCGSLTLGMQFENEALLLKPVSNISDAVGSIESSESENTNSDGGSSEKDTDRRRPDPEDRVRDGAFASSSTRGGSEERRGTADWDFGASRGASAALLFDQSTFHTAGSCSTATLGLGSACSRVATCSIEGSRDSGMSDSPSGRESVEDGESASVPTDMQLDSRESSAEGDGNGSVFWTFSASTTASVFFGITLRSTGFPFGKLWLWLWGLFASRAGPSSQSASSDAGSSGAAMMLMYAPLRWDSIDGATCGGNAVRYWGIMGEGAEAHGEVYGVAGAKPPKLL